MGRLYEGIYWKNSHGSVPDDHVLTMYFFLINIRKANSVDLHHVCQSRKMLSTQYLWGNFFENKWSQVWVKLMFTPYGRYITTHRVWWEEPYQKDKDKESPCLKYINLSYPINHIHLKKENRRNENPYGRTLFNNTLLFIADNYSRELEDWNRNMSFGVYI